MIPMISKYNIKIMHEFQGKSLRQISRETGHTFRTVKKYALMEDFSQKFIKKKGESKLDIFKETINSWIEQDLHAPPKQRHTAIKIFKRLKEEFPDSFNAGYRTVCSYTAKARKDIQTKINKKNKGMIPLTHYPGEAQLDFGETEFILNGENIRGNHLVISFPFSNHSYVQLFPSQNQEALFQGMKNIFEHIGAVPKEIWFDNMSTAVAQIKKGNKRKLTEGFMRFTAHYGYKPKFCNPASGNEKGHVENKVGYTRRNFMVPVPKIKSLVEFNKYLLKLSETDADRIHYSKNENILELFKTDLKSMIPLNKYPYEACKLLKVKTSKLGYLTFEKNEYSVLPTYVKKEVWIKVFVDKIQILNENYQIITIHKRSYEKNKKITNWKQWLEVVSSKINALEYTEFYQELPDIWKKYFKEKTNPSEKRKVVSVLAEMLIKSNMNTATSVLEYNLNKGITDLNSLLATFRATLEPKKIYSTIDQNQLNTPIQKIYEPNIQKYDFLLGGK